MWKLVYPNGGEHELTGPPVVEDGRVVCQTARNVMQGELGFSEFRFYLPLWPKYLAMGYRIVNPRGVEFTPQ